ncbi:hypothetical protein IX317_000544 [Fusobacterium sp. DD29]|uniref:TIGR03905 family TSCPD domain-containing protein n=1 Tax=unclassified Fusobacterium TaxID=2648384 RepID=UPI001B8D733A|nr:MULTISPECIES: TIGR03905 family TSCPD domain-containing protein [unclassified Fusobacterium]MBR8701228.1 hypothetical protein [Fusobacterium sp. DD45]MBR8710996.1 hypothetical protein [Fusobacterium sp. DD28]MBR8748883.1 hypothetical protein [Fusobacterium sp. DD29]MBR8751573.1 hypothetical protein [Fusobacterium sp. DD26]MBR8761150.1 hypothetical protein [Fusobacterium sp. DD25]
MTYYETTGICAKKIGVEVDSNGTITEVEFCGGCHGNTQGLTKLLIGMNKDVVINLLSGIQCGTRGTSCPDQLAQILKKI